ncbi:thiosulfate dehydrogenase [quinone] large subunit [Stackebrandtia endophytica]|uniref:Thiosulfate dehydrogenase [quinone] large subunit n=1 Tax=Stackebrandtia endophytica TaxID=1496996 RepID=A0A543B3Y2_9ACTN|nr:DoxX family membrane protein [Stackebrandtia endophytica]TQL79541.1 thiosulfate dehydrogenase [quinone] large subunit [Stackebrandtia endophytica]
MTDTTSLTKTPTVPTTPGTAPIPPAPEATTPTRPRVALGVARIALGWIFLWAFLDKAFGFGFATPPESAWINGGSPTTGYLTGQGGSDKALSDLMTTMSGQTWVDWLFMLGMCSVGIALILGIGMRLAALGATCLMGTLWLSQFPLAQNPFMDQHLLYLLLAIALAATNAGDTIGLGRPWSRTALVRTLPILR